VLPLRALCLAAPLLLLACGGDDEVDAGAPVTEITITSTRTEFDIEAFAVPAGEEITLTYDNRHGGVPHNVHVQIEGDPKTELAPGPDEQTITFTAPGEAGEHEYICDVHPGPMQGTMVVVEGDAG
jgi:plastocyanin